MTAPASKSAQRKFRMVQAALFTLGIIYLTIHGIVSWYALEAAGWVAATITFLTFGFGDVYWLWAWWNTPPDDNAFNLALAASIMAWASWLSRPFTRPALTRMALNAYGLEDIASRAAAMSKSETTTVEKIPHDEERGETAMYYARHSNHPRSGARPLSSDTSGGAA